MADDDANESFTDRIAREGEDVVAKLVEELSEHPLVRTLLERAFEARERAAQAQDVALAALNLPSASDIERLTRRIRSVSLRMEGLEDGVDRLGEHLVALVAASTAPGGSDLDRRLNAIEERLDRIAVAVASLAGQPTTTRGAAARKPAAKKPAATAARAPRSQPARAARPR